MAFSLVQHLDGHSDRHAGADGALHLRQRRGKKVKITEITYKVLCATGFPYGRRFSLLPHRRVSITPLQRGARGRKGLKASTAPPPSPHFWRREPTREQREPGRGTAPAPAAPLSPKAPEPRPRGPSAPQRRPRPARTVMAPPPSRRAAQPGSGKLPARALPRRQSRPGPAAARQDGSVPSAPPLP